jgi:hypothetical protein
MKPITRLSRRRGLHHPRRFHHPSPVAPTSELNVARALLELTSSTHGDWAECVRHVIQFDAEVLHLERVSFWSLDAEKTRIRCDEGYIASLRSFESGATLLRADLPAYFDALLEARIIDVEDVCGARPRAGGRRPGVHCDQGETIPDRPRRAGGA